MTTEQNEVEEKSSDVYDIHPGTIEFNIKQTITLILLRHPFYGFLLQTMKWRDASKWCETMATDGKHIYYNEKFFNSLNVKERTFGIAHELFHCMVATMGRLSGRDKQYWNMASDYAINASLVNDKVGTCKKDWLYDPKYHDMSADEIYKDLEKTKAAKKDTQDTHMDGLGDKRPEDESGDGDKDATGRPRISEEEMEKNMKEFKQKVIQAYQYAKMAGSVPGSVQKIVDELVNPKINWKRLLRTTIRSLFKNDTTWQKPNRRSIDRRFILPTTWFEDTVEVCVSIDTSGSITEDMKVEFLSEIMGIVQHFKNCKVTVWCFDTQVHNFKSYAQNEIFMLPRYELAGGGGTDIAVNFDFMKENKIRPKILCCFTDGYSCSSDWGPSNYCDTIWILHSNPKCKVPFGKMVTYEFKEK